ncbi:S8 family serine peptidase [Sinobaca sp. H24]|uniref:S8 family serine peptidase n=1 Tax=Sinobaca sp. H24 TaxID=2923376 RepID=UPI00207A7FE3|nr:S8 family serine peptidase [Sinobaca sp. H24]
MKKIVWQIGTSLLAVFIFLPMEADAEDKEIYIEYEDHVQEESIGLQSVDKQRVETISVPEEDYEETLEELENNEEIKFVEEEIYYEYTRMPNDPFMSRQKINFEKIGGYGAWSNYTPKYTPTIAVLDSGLQTAHSDISKAVVKPFNVVNQTTNVKDLVGHGTHVAGTAGAVTNNGIGVASLVKNAKIMPVKVGEATEITNMNIARGIHYAIDNKADIINLSLGGPTSSTVVQEAVNRANLEGILVVAAAGNNSSSNKFYPAASNGVLSVSAIDDKTNNIAGYSNYGSWVDVSAPGTNIWSICTKGSLYPFTKCSQSNPYIPSSGTSMAAPMVSSMAGMLKAQDQKLTNHQLSYLIESAASTKVGDNKKTKYGLTNAEAAQTLYKEENRLYGASSIKTSNEIALKGWSEINETTLSKASGEEEEAPVKGRFVIMANNQSFADSLAASGLSNRIDAPLLLTSPTRLDATTVNTMKKLNVTNVILLGGLNAVSSKVEESIQANGFETMRLRGSNRYETASVVNDYVAVPGGEVVVASGENFPDALQQCRAMLQKKGCRSFLFKRTPFRKRAGHLWRNTILVRHT